MYHDKVYIVLLIDLVGQLSYLILKIVFKYFFNCFTKNKAVISAFIFFRLCIYSFNVPTSTQTKKPWNS